MPKKKLYKESDHIQIVISKAEKTVFETICSAKQTTMSEVLRQAIKRYLAANKEIIDQHENDCT